MKTPVALLLATFLTGLASGQESPAELNSATPPIKFQVLQSRKIDLGNRFLIFNRVVPPILPEPPAPPPPTAEQIAAVESAAVLRPPVKKRETMFLFATVYDRKVTEIRWFGGDYEHRVFSNIDLNLFAGACDIETADTTYFLMLAVGNATTEQGGPKRIRKQVPPPESFSKIRSEYIVAEDETHPAPGAQELQGLDALHVYYDANRQRLTEEHVKREAEDAARAQWIEEHPPVPKDTVINFWMEEPKRQPDPAQKEVTK